MPNVFRLGCAGAVLIVIAALTSVGLYAVVAGGVSWASAVTRTASGVVPVLVTIQAAPVTQTLVPTSTPLSGAALPSTRAGAATATPGSAGTTLAPPAPAPTPAEPRNPSETRPPASTAAASSGSTSGGPGSASQPPTPQATAGTAQAATAPSGPIGSTGAAPTTPTTSAQAASATPVPPASAGEPSMKATHDGLTVEVLEVERGWDAVGTDGGAVRRRDGSELLTVHVRFTNETADLRYVADTDVVLVANDGARLAPRQMAPQREPHLLTVPAAGHDVVRGWLTYEVPSGVEPRRLQWSPTRPERPRADATYLLALPR